MRTENQTAALQVLIELAEQARPGRADGSHPDTARASRPDAPSSPRDHSPRYRESPHPRYAGGHPPRYAHPQHPAASQADRRYARYPSEDTVNFRVALNELGPRNARRLYFRLVRWKPHYRALALGFLLVLLPVGWFSEPYGGKLGWPLTILWTWPIGSTLIGIRGIARTRKLIRQSRARWDGDRLTVCEDALIVLVPTIGRHNVYPALERCVLSYVAYLPRCFPKLRIDLVIEEECEAADRIRRLAARSPLVRLIVVPRRYRTANGTRFKARANHYAHHAPPREEG